MLLRVRSPGGLAGRSLRECGWGPLTEVRARQLGFMVVTGSREPLRVSLWVCVCRSLRLPAFSLTGQLHSAYRTWLLDPSLPPCLPSGFSERALLFPARFPGGKGACTRLAELSTLEGHSDPG